MSGSRGRHQRRVEAAVVDRWLSEEMPAALELQRPLPDEALRIVAKGERSDGVPVSA
jgi:hypothetical protein